MLRNRVRRVGVPAGSFGALTPNDGLLNLNNGIAVTAGQTLTILPRMFTFNSGASFNPNVPAVFNGNVFAADGNRVRLSAFALVPEPSTWVAIAAGAGLLGVVAYRRRTAARA